MQYNRLGPAGLKVSRVCLGSKKWREWSWSSRRAGYVDLDQNHRIDYETPIEETIEALYLKLVRFPTEPRHRHRTECQRAAQQ